jgi:hypothetical protein
MAFSIDSEIAALFAQADGMPVPAWPGRSSSTPCSTTAT